MAARIASLGDDPSLTIRRTCRPRVHMSLRLDLRYSGCLELLVAPRPGTSDVGTLALLLELARGATLALDVGANVGLYTYLLAATLPDIRILSLEPLPGLAALIADNVRRNEWSSRVVVRQEAVGATRGTSLLYVMPRADTEHTLVADRVAGRDHESLSVPVVTIDEIISDSGTPLERIVLKIDVEGYERSTLDGMARMLHSSGSRPDVIMEFLGRAIHEGLLEHVMTSGMDVYYIGPSGITRLSTTSDLASVHTLGYWNFLLTSRPQDEVRGIWSRAMTRLRD
jgi:FkbM family methyltransferase